MLKRLERWLFPWRPRGVAPVYAPDDPEALLCHLRVVWIAELLRHQEQALAAGSLLTADAEETAELLREASRLLPILLQLFPDPAFLEKPPATSDDIPF